MRKEIARALADKFKIRVELEPVKQGTKIPCFFIKYINSKINKISFIEYSKVYTYDIIYYTNSKTPYKEYENIVSKLDEIFKKDSRFIDTEVEIVEDELHYILDISEQIKTLSLEHSNIETYNLIMEELREITGYKVFYQNGNLEELNRSFFILEPSTTTTESISLSARKEKQREITIRYIFLENLSEDIPAKLEGYLDKLIARIRGKNGIYNINYSLDISYDKEEFQDKNIINYEINLELIERSK